MRPVDVENAMSFESSDLFGHGRGQEMRPGVTVPGEGLCEAAWAVPATGRGGSCGGAGVGKFVPVCEAFGGCGAEAPKNLVIKPSMKSDPA